MLKKSKAVAEYARAQTKTIIVLRRRGFKFREIQEALVYPSQNLIAKIYYRNELLEISESEEIEIIQRFAFLLEEKELEEQSKETVKEQFEKWIDEKLVSKYAAKGEYDWLPVFFIKNHYVTHSTAKRIYLQLQALKRKQTDETPSYH